MSKNNASKLGTLGEELVRSLMGGKLSENIFDSEKDLTLDNGRTVEVKTQIRFKKGNCFSISASPHKLVNLTKCFLVDYLIFVEFSDVNDTINVYECVNRRDFKVYYINRGTKAMLGWNIGSMNKIYSSKMPSLSEQMRALSSSYLCA